MNDQPIIACTYCGDTTTSLISEINRERPLYECKCCGRFFRANATLAVGSMLRTTAEIAVPKG